MKCQKLVEEKLAIGIMKTGFYKKDIPVALQCADCSGDGDGKQESS
ncbi:hypothetical protein [Paenibacillus foliorum]|nr:hypothetical protein [Paenibacillus foliorum]